MLNTQCGHTYDRNEFNEHIRRCRSLTVKCPVAGCVGHVNQANLRPNKQIAELLSQDSSNAFPEGAGIDKIEFKS